MGRGGEGTEGSVSEYEDMVHRNAGVMAVGDHRGQHEKAMSDTIESLKSRLLPETITSNCYQRHTSSAASRRSCFHSGLA